MTDNIYDPPNEKCTASWNKPNIVNDRSYAHFKQIQTRSSGCTCKECYEAWVWKDDRL